MMKRMLELIIALGMTMVFTTFMMALADSTGFVLIPGGSFVMGGPESEPWRSADETAHNVKVSSFIMNAHEVTQDEYEAVMGVNPNTFIGNENPVEGVSWIDAIAYCNARSEAEGLTPAYRLEGQSVIWDRSADGYRERDDAAQVDETHDALHSDESGKMFICLLTR